MTSRTTKEIVTPNGHKVIIYDYITGGEARKIQSLYMENLSAGDFKGDTKEAISKLPVSVVYRAQEMALGLLILSVDGCPQEEAYQKAMDLREEDLDVLIQEIDEYTSGSKKKQSDHSLNTSEVE